MKLRVAYDVSVLGQHFGHGPVKTGIHRVVEEVLWRLVESDDLTITATGLTGPGYASSAILAAAYLKSVPGRNAPAFHGGFRSRAGVSTLYRGLYGVYLSDRFRRLPKWSPPSVAIRAPLQLLRRAQRWEARPVFDAARFDVFHSPYLHLPPRDLTGETPRVMTVYDLIPLLRPEFVLDTHVPYFRTIIESIDIRRDWVACISEFTKQEFCAYTGMAPERVFVTPLAAAEHFRPVRGAARIAAARARYGVPEGEYLLSLTTLEPRKNLAHLIRTYLRLRAEEPGFRAKLVLVGARGWLHDEILDAAAFSPFRSDVVFTGYVLEEDLSALYSGALAFVYPSLYEGFGLPPLEAMQCGTPVVTSSTTSLPEVVGDAALTVDPRDADALAGALLALAGDADLRRALGVRGLRRAERFSWERCAEATTALYHTAAEVRSPARV